MTRDEPARPAVTPGRPGARPGPDSDVTDEGSLRIPHRHVAHPHPSPTPAAQFGRASGRAAPNRRDGHHRLTSPRRDPLAAYAGGSGERAVEGVRVIAGAPVALVDHA